MALSLGELSAVISADDKGFQSALGSAEHGLAGLRSSTDTAMASVEATVTQTMTAVSRELGDAFDPQQALAGIDRLVAGFRAELDRLDDIAGRAGAEAGEELAEGFSRAVDDAAESARRAGEDAGRQFSDGTDEASRGRMGGIASGLISSLKAAPWLAAGAAIGAMLMDGLAGALDAEKAKAKLFAQIGATEEEMSRLGKVAGQVYVDGYGESMDEVTGVIASVIQNIDGMRNASDEALRSVSARAMEAAKILDEDVGRVTAAVSQMLRTGMAKSAEEAFDIIVKGAQEGVNKSQDLLDTFNEYSTEFRALGLDGQTALGLINQALKAGARDADVAADAIKEFAIEAVAGGDRVRKGFEAIGLNADEMVAKFAAGGPTAAKAFDLVLDRLRAITDPAERNAAAIELFGTKAEDLQGALLAMDPSTAVQSLGQVAGAAARAGDTLHDTAANRLESFKRSIQQNIVDFLGGTVIPAIQNFSQSISFDAIVDKIQTIADKAKGLFGEIFGDIEKWVSENKGTIDEWVSNIESGMDSIMSVVSSALDIIKGAWELFGDDILNIVETLASTITGVFSGLWKTVEGIFDAFAGIFTGDWDRFTQGLEKIWDGLWKTVESILTGALDLIKQQFSRGWETAKQLTGDAWDKLVKAVSDGIDKAVNFVKELPGKILKGLGNLGTLLLQAGRDLIAGLINGIREKAGEVAEAARRVAEGAVQGVKDFLGISSPSKVMERVGEDTVAGWIKGITSMAAKAAEALGKVLAPATGSSVLRMAKAVEAVRSVPLNVVASPTGASGGPLEQMPLSSALWDSAAAGNGGTALPAAPAGTVINVDMSNAVIREEADVQRVAREFAFALAGR